MNPIECNPDLSVTYCGLTIPNPFLLASAPPAATGAMIERAFSLGWGGAVTKTLKPDHMEIVDVRPRFAVWRDQAGKVAGFENIELTTKRSFAGWCSEITAIKAKYPDRILIASIMAEVIRSDWREMAKALEAAGADALELNFSCPHGMPEKGAGAAIGQVADVTEMITVWVKTAVDIPVIVKLTPNVTNVVAIAKAARQGGADGFAAINTVQCLLGVDLETWVPQPAVYDYSTFGGYSGAAVKPIGLRVVAQLAQNFTLPISGIGGIAAWEHAAEYMLLGAGTVQLGTAVMLRGYGIIDELTGGLTAYLRRRGLSSVQDLIGQSLGRLTDFGGLKKDDTLIARVDRTRCTSCGLCVGICRDSGYSALTLGADEGLSIDAASCDGCSLCTIVCPRQAISIA
ncbi:MAG: NAD-dependent dihydropyrimidine dehydrogenase subunit PreA [Negativicutes bacterium]|nr:NAD-dependent dihydropyrimidine dehydrogenase subunit PreA [Negativicutes bacterium]